jgi:hypothetical protein
MARTTKALWYLSLLWLFVAITPVCSAEERGHTEGGASEANVYTCFLEFGLTYYNFDYEEEPDPPLKSTEEEWLPGLYLGLGHSIKDALYTKLFIEYSQGETDYDGTTQAGVPLTDKTDNDFFRFEIDLGYTFSIDEGFSLTPYTGYGYRSWDRGLGGPAPFDEEYRWNYIPLGIKADFEITDRWSMGAHVAARIMFDGKMRACLSQVGPGFNNPTVDLGDKVGWFAQVPIRYKFAECWSVVSTPWYEYSKIGKSNEEILSLYGIPDRIIWEPASETYQYGIKMGVVYWF